MKERVLNYMLEFGSITTKQAFEDLGCTRLSEYIRQLRLDMTIDDEVLTGTNRYGEKVFWKRYFIRKGD
jgi:hypothetical protein